MGNAVCFALVAAAFGLTGLDEAAFLLAATGFFVVVDFAEAGFLTGFTALAESAFLTAFFPLVELLAGLLSLAATGFFFDFGFLADVVFFAFCGLTIVFDSRANR